MNHFVAFYIVYHPKHKYIAINFLSKEFENTMLSLHVVDQEATFYGHIVTWFISRVYCAALNFNTDYQ